MTTLEKMKMDADVIAMKLFERNPANMPTKGEMKFFDSYMKIHGGKAGNAGKRKGSSKIQKI